VGEAPPQLDDGAVNDLGDVGLGVADHLAGLAVGQAGGEAQAQDLAVAVVELRQVAD
jgi:hypothetical protein